eukprot:scaffold17084_cov130-Isochrysis_galbana.AAC.9
MPEREQAVRSAAKLFVSICESQAPFVAVENPRMHSLATDLVGGRKPTQYVQPYLRARNRSPESHWPVPDIQSASHSTDVYHGRTRFSHGGSSEVATPWCPTQSDVYWHRGGNGLTVDAYSSRIL